MVGGRESILLSARCVASSTCRDHQHAVARHAGSAPRLASHRQLAVLYAEGHLLFARQDTLYAQPFDPERAGHREPDGDPDGSSGFDVGCAAFWSSETARWSIARCGGPGPYLGGWVRRSISWGPVGAHRNPALSTAAHGWPWKRRTECHKISIVEAGGALSRFAVDREQRSTRLVARRQPHRVRLIAKGHLVCGRGERRRRGRNCCWARSTTT
jgi:hypothetical protein